MQGSNTPMGRRPGEFSMLAIIIVSKHYHFPCRFPLLVTSITELVLFNACGCRSAESLSLSLSLLPLPLPVLPNTFISLLAVATIPKPHRILDIHPSAIANTAEHIVFNLCSYH